MTGETVYINLAKDEFQKLKDVDGSDKVVFLCSELLESFTICGIYQDYEIEE